MKKFILLLCCFISLLNGMEITMKKESDIKNDGINLILGLDRVFLNNCSEEIKRTQECVLKESLLVQDSSGNNYIVPAYLPEFLKFAVSRFNISFFNDNDDEVNRSVVENIWLKVFGTSTSEKVRILSRNDFTDALHNDNHELQSRCWYGSKKKDIRKVGGLHNTILVGDNEGSVLKGQESNFLSVIGDDFYSLLQLVEYYSDRDKNEYQREIDECFADGKYIGVSYFHAFYKLLYIAGVLDIAAEHETSIIDGLRAIQFKNDVPKFSESERDLQYYKRGYRVLLTFSITQEQKILLHLLHAHPEAHWFVLPQELRQLIVAYMMQLIKDTMCIFPEIEKYFCS